MKPWLLIPALLLLLASSACTPGDAAEAALDGADGAWTAIVRGEVAVQGGLVQVSALQTGRVEAIAVPEGAQVSPGDVLIELDRQAAQQAVDVASAELEQAQAELKALQARHGAAQRYARRLQAAAKAGAGAGQTADEAQAQEQELAASMLAAQARIKLAGQRLDAARLALERREITASHAGQVVAIHVQTGAIIGPDSGALMTLLPQAPLIIRAEIAPARAASLQTGQPARVSTEDEDRHWDAHVTRISPIVEAARLSPDGPARSGLQANRFELELDEPATAEDLKPGQQVLVKLGPDGDG